MRFNDVNGNDVLRFSIDGGLIWPILNGYWLDIIIDDRTNRPHILAHLPPDLARTLNKAVMHADVERFLNATNTVQTSNGVLSKAPDKQAGSKAYLFQVLVVDTDALGLATIKERLSAARFIYPSIISAKEANIGEWHDDHALNKRNTIPDAVQRLFDNKDPVWDMRYDL